MTTLRLFPMRLEPPRGLDVPRWALAWLAAGRRLVRHTLSSYRPERHYMRGPGPACAAKRLSRTPDTVSPD
ncbi:MAG: hypothetical protein DCC74_08660 [Proteobacteria bacterium]|nr:MAG: hypothetical protein DCC74_08660 [Pseudomonadota bacterium]